MAHFSLTIDFKLSLESCPLDELTSISCELPTLSFGSFELELVSDAHELNAVGSKFLFKPTPIVTSLYIIRLIINCTNYINSREPPFGFLLIPYRSHLTVVIESDGYFGHKRCLYLLILLILLSKFTHNLVYYGNLHIYCSGKLF